MPMFKVRRLLQAQGGLQVESGLASGSTGTNTFGSTNSKLTVATDGRQTMTGCARAYKQIFLRPTDFIVGEDSGSMATASANLNVTGSIFAGSYPSASMMTMQYLMRDGGTDASLNSAFATFPVPLDADTTGSITAYVDWAANLAQATTGCKAYFRLGLAYLGSGSIARTAASMQAVPAATVVTAGVLYSSCIGLFPSFGANDSLAVLALQTSPSAAGETIGGSALRIYSVRLKYVANSDGTAVAE